MPPSISHERLLGATTVSPSLAGVFTNFVPDYLDQWALKDPGKDKHGGLWWGGGGRERGVRFQTEQKSP